MKKTIVILVLALLTTASMLQASSSFNESFNGGFHRTWYFMNYEDDSGTPNRHPGVACGVDACAKVVGNALEVSIYPSTTAGVYTGTDVSEVNLNQADPTETGPWNPEVDDPVVLEARVKWSGNFNPDGSGAVGTSGVVLWNSAVSPFGPYPSYDQIGFEWADNTILGGYLAGFTASAVVDLNPFYVVRPASINLQQWNIVKLVWSVNASGQQSVTYYVNGSFIGTTVLPVPLHNLSVEIWNDNQQPGFAGFTYPSPAATQSIFFDWVKVTE